MNRQIKRMQQKMGTETTSAGAAIKKVKSKRVGPIQFFKEVKQELSKVGWPPKKEVIRSTIAVVVCLVVVTGTVFAMDFGFGKLVTFIFN